MNCCQNFQSGCQTAWKAARSTLPVECGRSAQRRLHRKCPSCDLHTQPHHSTLQTFCPCQRRTKNFHALECWFPHYRVPQIHFCGARRDALAPPRRSRCAAFPNPPSHMVRCRFQYQASRLARCRVAKLQSLCRSRRLGRHLKIFDRHWQGLLLRTPLLLWWMWMLSSFWS